MGANTNIVVLAGNLTRDPELKYTPAGTALCKFGVANNQKYNSKDGQAQQRVTYVDCVAWERQAETLALHLRKGSPVLVEGELQLDTWEKDGQKHSKLTVRAHRVQFLGQAPEREIDGQGRLAGSERQATRGRF